MVSKHISCKPENDNYKRLAQYIADASHKGEKCLLSWCVGCEGSDNDYQSAIAEVLDIQDINTRSSKEKTYHLVVSLRTEDEGKLSEQDYQDIELEFAKALGFQAHQRHCGVHKNTDNLHMHIAYNMINPETYRRYEPYRDYYTLERTCRFIEEKYNLSIDNGIEKDDSYKLSNNSASKESRTGEESFERYVVNRHDKIMQELENIHSWQSLHRVFAEYGLELTQRGNGLSIKNKKGNQRLKASKFDKELSYKKLIEKFGNFQTMKSIVQAKDWYRRTPLQKNALESKLWREFIEDTKQRETYQIKEKWKKEKIKITGLAVTR